MKISTSLLIFIFRRQPIQVKPSDRAAGDRFLADWAEVVLVVFLAVFAAVAAVVAAVVVVEILEVAGSRPGDISTSMKRLASGPLGSLQRQLQRHVQVTAVVEQEVVLHGIMDSRPGDISTSMKRLASGPLGSLQRQLQRHVQVTAVVEQEVVLHGIMDSRPGDILTLMKRLVSGPLGGLQLGLQRHLHVVVEYRRLSPRPQNPLRKQTIRNFSTRTLNKCAYRSQRKTRNTDFICRIQDAYNEMRDNITKAP
ncbi:hypothetical protein HRG_012220 [Hirsutella rhossiliensis]